MPSLNDSIAGALEPLIFEELHRLGQCQECDEYRQTVTMAVRDALVRDGYLDVRIKCAQLPQHDEAGNVNESAVK